MSDVAAGFRAMTRLLACVVGMASLLDGQASTDSRPSGDGPLASLRPVMVRLNEGHVDLASIRTVVEGLVKSDHAIAAGWWVDLAEQALAEKKLPASDREPIAALKRATERPDSFPAERKLALGLIRLTESLVADKSLGKAARHADMATFLLALIPDATLVRLLDAAARRIPAGTKVAEAPGEDRTDLERRGDEACERLIELFLSEYRDAGCRPGRHSLGKAIRTAAGFRPPEERRAWRQRLASSMKDVEPAAGLRLFVRAYGTGRLLCEGEPVVPKGATSPLDLASQPAFVDIPALAGDRIRIELDGPYAANPGSGQVYIVGLHARWDSKDLDSKQVFCDLSNQPGSKLLPAPLAHKRTNPPQAMFGKHGGRYDEALRDSKTWFDVTTPQGPAHVPWYSDLVFWQGEFDTLKLVPIWVGTETEPNAPFAIVIKIPAP